MIYNLPNEFLKNKNINKTNNEIFEQNGYLICKNFINLQNIKYPFLHKVKQFVGKGKAISYEIFDEVDFNKKIISEYNFLHHQFSKKLENILKVSFLPTFYYGKTFLPGEDEKISIYDGKCEIAVCVNINYTTKEKIVYHIIDNTNNVLDFRLNYGDILIFKPKEIPFWIDPLKGDRFNFIRRIFNTKTKYYHHMIFFYVFESGQNCILSNEFY